MSNEKAKQNLLLAQQMSGNYVRLRNVFVSKEFYEKNKEQFMTVAEIEKQLKYKK